MRSTPGVWPLCFLRFVIAAIATGKAAVVLASLPKFDVGNVVDGLAVATATRLFAVCALHGLMLPRATEPPAKWYIDVRDAKPNWGMSSYQNIPRQATNTDLPGI
jgi:hypothetical protein